MRGTDLVPPWVLRARAQASTIQVGLLTGVRSNSEAAPHAYDDRRPIGGSCARLHVPACMRGLSVSSSTEVHACMHACVGACTHVLACVVSHVCVRFAATSEA
eukprot:GHVU01042352.1.p2 GENE.GHVU01042352.1~~GHVU01042352.1.p2  ORF type:complete len:103 (-),score=5.04 GHVU01042352.1:2-310(-)